MIILDTNVVSALMLRPPVQEVLSWLNREPDASVWITSITVLEIRTGIEIMPESLRRTMLSEDFELLLQEDLEGRVINFDSEAAHATAALIASRRKAGRPGELRDSMIAGIVIAAGAALATRNTRHFDDLPINVVNPWST